MKITLGTLWGSTGALVELQQIKLPAVTAFRLRGLIKQIQGYMDDLNPSYTALCEKHGKLSPDKTKYNFSKEKQPKFQAEMDELMGTEVELNFEPLSIMDFRLADGISVGTLNALDWMIAEDKEKAKAASE